MTISLNATCSNTTGMALTFYGPPALHGKDPVAAPTTLRSGASATVTAVPIDTVLGPSPEGTFVWELPNEAGQFVFAYDLHDDPISIQATGTPGGYAVTNCSIDADGNASVTLALAGDKPTTVMPQIKTIVFLMLENRSLDNVLGWLETASNVTYFPEGSTPSFDGLANATPSEYGDYPPAKGTGGKEPCRVPAFDPYETMEHVQIQLYADGTGKMPGGDFWVNSPPMSGFAWDYDQGPYCMPGESMGAYSPAQLPVLSGLAQHYAVSDRWFSSVPSQTDPNRAFSLCGTSLGAEDNSDIDENTFADAKTIFNVLGEAGKSWGLYWQMDDPLGDGEPGTWKPFTSYYFSRMNQAPGGGVYTWNAFLAALDGGTLPDFCYLEPYWGGGGGIDCSDWVGIQGNDYHPPEWVGPAEASLLALFNKIVTSDQWKNMLFVITFDEHGGTFDHAAPTPAKPPDGCVGRTGFKFDRLGVRVPTILVSPFIAGPTVFRAPCGSTYDFDHTSFLATFCKWAGVLPASAGLGARVAVAPTFEDVLSPEAATSGPPSLSVPAGYADQGGGVGAILGMGDTAQVAAAPIDVRAFRRAMEKSGDRATLAANLRALLRGR